MSSKVEQMMSPYDIYSHKTPPMAEDRVPPYNPVGLPGSAPLYG